jgi:hypothetical protein
VKRRQEVEHVWIHRATLLLANIYLHEVLDTWFEDRVKPVLRGPAFLVRYADDFVICFGREDDARRVLAVLPKRFGKYGLTLHPDKTRLVRFDRPPHRGKPPEDDGPGSFHLLGFTHYWGRSRSGNRGRVPRKRIPAHGSNFGIRGPFRPFSAR